MAYKKSGDDIYVYENDDFRYRIGEIIGEKVFSDVTFVLDGGKEKVSGHKLLLVASSPVFKSMFSDASLVGSEVIIDDPKIDAENFELFIQNVSTGKMKIKMENVTQQIYLADKYKVDSLKDFCSKFLAKKVKFSNVLEFLQIADRYGMESLKEACIEAISYGSSDETKHVELFSKLSSDHFIAVIDYLLSCEEQDWVHDQAYRHLKAMKAWLLDKSNGAPSRK